ncbi:hypothetical protein PCASD_22265 [Puccinia coronata f. sp. avenae]|uniref:Uncharacterized protein n=1 Tax=Puccinia coronata f. sp. avenae TaxID=200324 RepID=A0A2N5S2X3_9BASI|nr:hypothetical protein PCASD_22265 [Puccinia coronata f. sp. avenae]
MTSPDQFPNLSEDSKKNITSVFSCYADQVAADTMFIVFIVTLIIYVIASCYLKVRRGHRHSIQQENELLKKTIDGLLKENMMMESHNLFLQRLIPIPARAPSPGLVEST